MRTSVTISNRRVRTRTHGGVAGVSGQPLPLCRSNAPVFSNSKRQWPRDIKIDLEILKQEQKEYAAKRQRKRLKE